MRPLPALLLSAALAAGCKTDPRIQNDTRQDPRLELGTRNEREAEETVRRAFACYANWDLEGAYQLICKTDRAKISLEDFKKGSEQNKSQLMRTAATAKIVSSGETTVEGGTPYVAVVVKTEMGEILPYGVIREPEGWRLVLVDPARARQSR